MTVHVGSFYNPHSPVVLLVHGNTRNHVKSHLEVTCKMVDQNQTYGLLAAAEEENQLGLHWPFVVDFGSALRTVSSVVWPVAFLGKQQHKITKNHQIKGCTECARRAFCNLSNNTFNATVEQLMRRADCRNSNLRISRAFESSPA